jgi:hypothetical protein
VTILLDRLWAAAATGRTTRDNARFLVLTSRRVESRQSGYDLRVANLCAHLPGEVHLVVAPFQPAGDVRPGLLLDGVFDTVEELVPMRPESSGVRRHLRLSNTRFLELTRPRAVAAARARIARIVQERGITDVVVFGGDVAELATGLTGVRTVVDVCDSAALTAVRAGAARTGPAGGAQRLKELLDVHRKRRTESGLTRRFDVVTTISDADSRAVEGPRGVPGTVHTVPNGLDDAYAGPLPVAGERRGVVFWGNQTFAPNQEALRFFVHDVFLPRLRDHDVELCVVGAEPPAWLVELAAEEPAIVLPGYVDDLRATVGRYPIMINPMRSGSGLKNKVLEAFGLGLVVVSTPMGVEALPVARDGAHLVSATSATDFADAVLGLLDDPVRRGRLREAAHALVARHYRWETVGRSWCALVGGHRLGGQPPVRRGRSVASSVPAAWRSWRTARRV